MLVDAVRRVGLECAGLYVRCSRTSTSGVKFLLIRKYSRMEMLPTPTCLKDPMRVPYKLLMGPGPSNCPPRVLQAMLHPLLGHLHPEFTKIMDDVKSGLRYVFQTNARVVCCISGTGHAGMEALLCNLLEPQDVILIGQNGIWGERAAEMSRRQGADVRVLEKAAGGAFTLGEIEAGLAKHRPALLFLVQGESSTGVLQHLEGVGHLCKKHGSLLAVDTVASLGGTPFYMDDWQVDAVYTGSQKVISAPPSLAPIAFNDRAMDKVMRRKTPIRTFYSDITWLANYWGCDEGPRRYHHTGPISSIYALREALAIVCEERLESSWSRHLSCARQLHTGLESLGLEMFVKDACLRLPTVNTIKVPDGVDWTAVVKHFMAKYMVEISGGLGTSAGKVWRVGLMGHNCTKENVELVLQIMKEALMELKTSGSKL